VVEEVAQRGHPVVEEVAQRGHPVVEEVAQRPSRDPYCVTNSVKYTPITEPW
jgi:hypothetical protein